MEIKLCIDCAHFLPAEARCGKDQMPPDYVYGKPITYYPAQASRQSSSAKDCGPEAKHFEPKASA